MRSNAQQPPPARRQPQSVPQEQLSRGERGEAEPSRGEAEEEPRSREAEEPYPQSRCCASPRRHQLLRLSDVSNTRASVYATCVTVEQARPARSLRRHLCVCLYVWSSKRGNVRDNDGRVGKSLTEKPAQPLTII